MDKESFLRIAVALWRVHSRPHERRVTHQLQYSKMLNWCFDPQDNVRGWGVTLGNWNGYDCAGLVGEVIGDDYAFAMNTFEMIGALAPLVRYDERFARAIGKWALNAANASRLFYHPYLPAENQDSKEWAATYDKDGVIAYEALREKDLNSNKVRLPPAMPNATAGRLQILRFTAHRMWGFWAR